MTTPWPNATVAGDTKRNVSQATHTTFHRLAQAYLFRARLLIATAGTLSITLFIKMPFDVVEKVDFDASERTHYYAQFISNGLWFLVIAIVILTFWGIFKSYADFDSVDLDSAEMAIYGVKRDRKYRFFYSVGVFVSLGLFFWTTNWLDDNTEIPFAVTEVLFRTFWLLMIAVMLTQAFLYVHRAIKILLSDIDKVPQEGIGVTV
jgi:hypothetical protein